MEKLYNDKGQVAVAVSYDYGAGWSTWVDVSPMDKEFNELILAKEIKKAIQLAESKGFYAGGLGNCELEWLDEGTAFRITEYDGLESLEIIGEIDYLTA